MNKIKFAILFFLSLSIASFGMDNDEKTNREDICNDFDDEYPENNNSIPLLINDIIGENNDEIQAIIFFNPTMNERMQAQMLLDKCEKCVEKFNQFSAKQSFIQCGISIASWMQLLSSVKSSYDAHIFIKIGGIVIVAAPMVSGLIRLALSFNAEDIVTNEKLNEKLLKMERRGEQLNLQPLEKEKIETYLNKILSGIQNYVKKINYIEAGQAAVTYAGLAMFAWGFNQELAVNHGITPLMGQVSAALAPVIFFNIRSINGLKLGEMVRWGITGAKTTLFGNNNNN